MASSPGSRWRLNADFWKRLAWTIGLLAVVPALWFVPLVGVDTDTIARLYDEGTSGSGSSVRQIVSKAVMLRTMSIGSFGLGYLPLAVALVLLALGTSGRVERRLQAAGGWSAVETWSARLCLPLTLVMSTWLLNMFADPGYRYLVPEQGIASFYLPNLAALAAGTSITLIVARGISRHGLGDGSLMILSLFPVATMVLALTWIPVLVRAGGIGIEHLALLALPLLLLLALGGAIVFAARRLDVVRTDGTAGAAIVAIPLCPVVIWPLLAAASTADFLPHAAIFMGFFRLSGQLQPGEPLRLGAELTLTVVLGLLGARCAFNPNRVAEDLKAEQWALSGVSSGGKPAEFLKEVALRAHLAGIGLLIAIGLTKVLMVYAWTRITLDETPTGGLGASVAAVVPWLILKSAFKSQPGDATKPHRVPQGSR